MSKRPPSLKAAFDETPSPEPRWLTLVLAGTAAALIAAVFLAVALIGYGWGWWVASAVTYVAAGFTVRGTHRALRRPVWIACAALAGLVALGAVLGALSTDIVAGKPVASWSIEARVAHDIKVVDGDLRALQRADALLVLDLTAARARLDGISAARAEMQDLSAAASDAQGASDETDAAFESIAKSADAAAQALNGKLQIAQQYDTRIESEIELLRDTLIAEALRAAQFSRQAAAIVGIELGVQE